MEDTSSTLSKSFISDDPEVEKDYFKRKPFAQQISNIIVSRKEPSSIVVGIYGKWGEGKTTVLNFIENELTRTENIICIRYNPWYYSDEVMLLQDFFNVLAGKLEKVSSSNDLKAQVKKYGKHISQFATSKSTTINLGPLQFNPFSSDSFLDLTESKKEIQAILKSCNIRIVVLMDDIDRLDKNEIQSIFKLVKLSADFYYLDYILAFDEEMVASAIGDKYGSNDIESGRNFLEKIISVPLHLPQIGETALFYYLRDGIDNNVLPMIKQKFTEEEHEVFIKQFRKGLQVRLNTPRMAKRYQNALIFALPILEDEVNIVDLMLIEGVRVFYPKMYDLIKNNAEVFINSNLLLETELKKSFERINNEIESLPFQERDPFRDLIAFLFPGSQRFSNTSYSSYPVENQQSLARKRRISSLRYFNRYFSYAVPAGDISDLEIDHLIENITRTEEIDDRETEGISSQIIELIKANGPGSADSFISKIYRINNKLDVITSQKLALSISKLSEHFPKNSCLNLIEDLLRKMPLTTRVACSKKMIESARSICFALNTYYTINGEEMQFLAEDTESLKDIIKNRIKNEIISKNEPIYVRYSCGGFIFHFLRDCGCKEELSKYIEKTFSLDSSYSLKFLKCFHMIMHSSSGESKTFMNENYDSIAELIDPGILYDALHNIYSN
ncbi:MAG: P-loop NTPase fold protein, partial [Candidatus Cloacimonetes bacterium]|nr:P-loop NTPase fold protein [Candidatus Cloacimonadota bacterium]